MLLKVTKENLFDCSHSRKGFHSLPDFITHVLSVGPQDLSRFVADAGQLAEELLSKETLHFFILLCLSRAHGILLLQTHRSLWFIGWVLHRHNLLQAKKRRSDSACLAKVDSSSREGMLEKIAVLPFMISKLIFFKSNICQLRVKN